MAKTLRYNSYGRDWAISLTATNYQINGNTAVRMNCLVDGYYEPFANLTVNLDEKLPEGFAFIDINNLPGAEDFVEKNELGHFTGKWGRSGFCVYPLYELDLEKISEHSI